MGTREKGREKKRKWERKEEEETERKMGEIEEVYKGGERRQGRGSLPPLGFPAT